MKRVSYVLLVALIIALLPSFDLADFKPGSGEIKGYMFAEYYAVLNHNSGSIDDGGIEGRHGFWFRRIYFTYDNKISDTIKTRLRLEFNSPGKLPFDSGEKLVPAIKDAFLAFKISGQELVTGIISTPTWGRTVEDFWGYRSVEKTPLDLMKLGSSRDFGIALKGDFNKKGTASYMIMFGNGASNKGETDKHKKFYGALTFKPSKRLILEAYGDYENQPSDRTYYVLQGFGGYKGDWGRIGAQIAMRKYEHGDSGDTYNILSCFAVIKASKDVDVLLRFDSMSGDGFESNFRGSGISYIPFATNPGAAFNLIIGGLSYQVAKNVWLIPNIKYAFYGDPDDGDKPEEDIYSNLTLWFKF